MEKILCACGCGMLIEACDKRGRPRRYVQWHGTKNPSEEIRKKISDARTGTHMKEESKRKVSEANKGRHRTEEMKKKMSESRTGDSNHFFGKHHSEETKKKISKAIKGKIHMWTEEAKEKVSKSLTGREFSEAHKKHLSVALKGRESPFKGKKHSEETKKIISMKNKIHQEQEDIKQRQREKRKKQVLPKHHTQPELIFEKICKNNNLSFHYVGDGSLWIGKDKFLNPDFVEANGQKICVEIDGDYWHSPLLNPYIKEERTISFREKHYRKYGWIPIFIWETDLKRDDAEEFVLTLLEREVGINILKKQSEG